MAPAPGPATGAAGAPEAPPMPSMSSMMPMLVTMMLMMGLYMVDNMGGGHLIGGALNSVFRFIDFGGQYPVPTLMLMGAVMVVLTTAIRAWRTDIIGQARNQEFMSAFNRELREARMENNLYKVKKLMDLQPAVMSKSMEASTGMMKIMPYTMLIIIPIFLWVRYFVDVTLRAAGTAVIAIPWAAGGVNLMDVYAMFPAWILIYSLISIPLGQVVSRAIRWYQFKRRLDELNSEAPGAEAA